MGNRKMMDRRSTERKRERDWDPKNVLLFQYDM